MAALFIVSDRSRAICPGTIGAYFWWTLCICSVFYQVNWCFLYNCFRY